MPSEFARRLQEMVEAVRTEARHQHDLRVSGTDAAKSRRRHLEKAAMEELRALLREADPVLAGLGLRVKETPSEISVAAIPGARLEAHPPWLAARCREPAFPDVRVAVMEISWRVDDPRTPLPEAPNVLRAVADDDSAGAIAELRDFLAVALENFVAAVTKFDALPGA